MPFPDYDDEIEAAADWAEKKKASPSQEQSLRTWAEIKASDDPIDRLVVFINGLSPHNLWKGIEAIQESNRQARIDELEVVLAATDELSVTDLERYEHHNNGNSLPAIDPEVVQDRIKALKDHQGDKK